MNPPDHIHRLAVVATHNRPAELQRLIDAIAPQCDFIVIIDNASDPPVPHWEVERWPTGRAGTEHSCWVKVIHDPEQPPNLSRLWNRGLQVGADLFSGGERYDVAVLNDDAVPPPRWWDAMSAAMRSTGADAASGHPFGFLGPGEVRVLGADTPMGVSNRLTGWAMLLRGEWDGARFDETMRWWASDDDMSHRARLAGGLVQIGGFEVPNTGADTSTVGVLAEQAGRDMARFEEKWGRRPW